MNSTDLFKTTKILLPTRVLLPPIQSNLLFWNQIIKQCTTYSAVNIIFWTTWVRHGFLKKKTKIFELQLNKNVDKKRISLLNYIGGAVGSEAAAAFRSLTSLRLLRLLLLLAGTVGKGPGSMGAAVCACQPLWMPQPALPTVRVNKIIEVLLPPKLQRRGLVFKGKLVTMERVWWVTMIVRVMGYFGIWVILACANFIRPFFDSCWLLQKMMIYQQNRL